MNSKSLCTKLHVLVLNPPCVYYRLILIVKAGMYMELRKGFWLKDVFTLTDNFKDWFNVFLPLTAKCKMIKYGLSSSSVYKNKT